MPANHVIMTERAIWHFTHENIHEGDNTDMAIGKAFSCLLFALALSIQGAPAQALDMEALKRELASIVQGKRATVGIAVIFNGAETLTINNDASFPLMSVFKFHQALAVAKKLEERGIPLSEEIFIGREDLPGGTHSPLRDKYPQGNIRLPVRELLAFTLQLSDNNACDILFRRVASPADTDAYVRSLGIGDFSISQTEKDMHDDPDNCYKNSSTPLAVARLLEIFLSGELLSAPCGDEIRKLMIECETGRERLAKPLPAGRAIIGHKTGTGDKNSRGEIIGLNDAGFVILPDKQRYTIAVLIRNSSESFRDTEKIIADISAAVYRHMAPGR